MAGTEELLLDYFLPDELAAPGLSCWQSWVSYLSSASPPANI